MSRVAVWVVFLALVYGGYSVWDSWEPPSPVRDVSSGFFPLTSPVLRDMPALPPGCRERGECPP